MTKPALSYHRLIVFLLCLLSASAFGIEQGSHFPLPEFHPAWWAPGGHLQTLIGHFLRADVPLKNGTEEILTLADGDQLSLFYYPGKSDTVIYVFHGLSGSVHSGYMGITAQAALELQHSVFLVNHRGEGEGARLQHAFPYHSGRAEDLSQVIAFGRKKFPKKKHIAIGYSLSANALLLLVANQRAHVLPDAAMAFNGPIGLNSASESLTQGFNKIYDQNFLKSGQEKAKEKFSRGWVKDLAPILAARTLREFDEAYVAPYGGFKNRDDYYQSCSAMNYLDRISVPTFVVTAKDDPFVDVKNYEQAKLSPMVKLFLFNSGGHLGYVSRESGLSGETWLAKAVKAGIGNLAEKLKPANK